MPVNDPKSVVDMALGAATTVAFAFGPVGVEVAAVIAVGKLLFDLLYPAPTKALTDPLAQAPSQADLNNALAELRVKLDKDMFNEFKTTYQAQLFAASTTLDDAIRNAGQAPKKGACLPGQTPVWNDAETDPLWQPVRNNPSILLTTQEWITDPANAIYRYQTAPLYALTVGLHLLYYKTGIVWEINNNQRDYEARQSAYDLAVQTYNSQMLIWTAQGKPPASKPAPVTLVDPSPPSWGDPADGSETVDRGAITGYKSRLGKAQSWFAIQTRNLLQQVDSKGNPSDPITYLESVLNAHDADIAAKNKLIDDRLALVVDFSKVTGTPGLPWIDTKTSTPGTAFPLSGFQVLQSQLWKDSLAGNIDKAEMEARDIASLTVDDKSTLRAVVSKWRDTLKMYQDAL